MFAENLENPQKKCYLCIEEKKFVGFSEKDRVSLLGMRRLMHNGCNSTLNNQQPVPN